MEAPDDITRFHAACAEGRVDEVQGLLPLVSKKEFNMPGPDGLTAFYRACDNGHAEVVRLLLADRRVSPRKPCHGRAPLHAACAKGHPTVVSLLIDCSKPADINRTDKDGATPYIVAAREGHAEVVRLLLGDQRTDYYSIDKNHLGAAAHAVRKGHTAVVKVLIEQSDHIAWTLTTPSGSGKSPLGEACTFGNLEIVKLVVARIPHVVVGEMHPGVPILHQACGAGHVPIAEFLLQAGCPPNKYYAALGTPFLAACKQGHAEMVRYLLQRPDVDPTIPQYGGNTALHVACAAGRAEVVRLLLADPRIDVTKKTDVGLSALYIACVNNHGEVARLLVDDERVDPSQFFHIGNCLFTALAQGKDNVYEALLRHRRVNANAMYAVPDHPHLGVSLLHHLAEKGDLDRIEHLVMYSSRLVLVLEHGPSGKTPVDVAMAHGHHHLVPVLQALRAQPRAVRSRLLWEKGSVGRNAGAMFAVMVFASDGLLRIRPDVEAMNPTPRTARFFKIATRLPMELQMRLAAVFFGQDRDFIPWAIREEALGRAADYTRRLSVPSS